MHAAEDVDPAIPDLVKAFDSGSANRHVFARPFNRRIRANGDIRHSNCSIDLFTSLFRAAAEKQNGRRSFVLRWCSRFSARLFFVSWPAKCSNVGSALLKTDVFFSLFLGSFVFKTSRRLRLREYAATVVMLIGVLLILDIRPGAVHFHKTDLFFIASSLCVTLNAFLIQHIQKKYATKNDIIAFYNNLFTMLLFLAAHFCTQEPQIALQRDPQLLLFIAAAGLTQALIYLLYYRGLSIYPVWFIKTVLLLMPVFSMFLNLLLFHANPSLQHILGTVIVLTTAAYILYTQKEFS